MKIELMIRPCKPRDLAPARLHMALSAPISIISIMRHICITTVARGYSISHDELAWWTASCAVDLVSCHVDRESGASAVGWVHLRLSRHGDAVGARHALGLTWHSSANGVVERVGGHDA